MPDNHYDTVVEIIKNKWGDNPEITFLEIGVAGGMMERRLYNTFPKINIVCIDPSSNPFNEEEQKRIKFINKTSSEAAKEFSIESIEFVYIDGEHTENPFMADISNYKPFVKKGGILGGHDYGPSDWAVKCIVDNMFSKEQLNIGLDLVWWVNV